MEDILQIGLVKCRRLNTSAQVGSNVALSGVQGQIKSQNSFEPSENIKNIV